MQISCEATGGDVQVDLKGEAQGPLPAYSPPDGPISREFPVTRFEFPVSEF